MGGQTKGAHDGRDISASNWPSSDAGQSIKLPLRLRLLCVGECEPSWVTLTLQLDAEGCIEPHFRWVSTSQEALKCLRDESFDCVLIGQMPSGPLGENESLSLLRALRTSGCDDPVLLTIPRLDDAGWAETCQRDCDLLLTPNPWESRALVPCIKRAIARVELLRENHRLAVANHRRLIRERDEAEHLLSQQRQIIQELEAIAKPSTLDARPECDRPSVELEKVAPPVGQSQFPLPDEIKEYYHELLRTYVIMGSGSLGSEIAKLAEVLSVAGLSPREALELHLERVESLVRGLGNRSTRHVMARADLLALELMIHLGECYQRISGDRAC